MENFKERDIDIIQLKFPENIRRRPGKAIGSTDNPNVILREVIDNAVDEIFGSMRANHIWVRTNKYNPMCIVADNGRGLPIIWDKVEGKTKAELAVASLDAGSKFSKTIDTVATGMNGYGVSCTNALSDHFIVLSMVTKENYNKSIPAVKDMYDKNPGKSLFYFIEFKKGIKQDEGCIEEESAKDKWEIDFPSRMSTIVALSPDPEIFKSVEAHYPTKNLYYVKVVTEKFYKKLPKVTIDDSDVNHEFDPFKFEFTKDLSVKRWNGDVKAAKFYVNFELSKDMSDHEFTGSVNSLVCDNGVHLNYMKEAYKMALQKLYHFDHSHILNALKLNVIVLAGEVDFSSQTKERLTKLDGLWEEEVAPELSKEFIKIMKANKDYFDDHVERLNAYAATLTKISTINKIKNSMNHSGASSSKARSRMPAELVDALSSNRSECELFITEGKSAGGNIIQARTPDSTQAVIQLRGVPMNAINADLDTFLDNPEMQVIYRSIGAGVNEFHDVSNSRYGKMIIAADADPDGYRIAALIIGMFAKKMTFLLEKGMVYFLETPIYRQGDKYIYQSDDIEKELDTSKPFIRYKGLGKFNVSDLRVIATGKETRRLVQITLEDVDSALNLLTSSYARKCLMADKGILIDPFNLGIYL